MDNVVERENWDRKQAEKRNLYQFRRLKWAEPEQKLKMVPEQDLAGRRRWPKFPDLPWEPLAMLVIGASIVVIWMELT